LRDIAPLVDGYRKAGLKVRLDMSVDESGAVPGPLGRDAYRIVREALTNVSKHAGTTAAAVSLSGCAGEGLLVEVRNTLPVGGGLAAESEGELPGSGLGLVSLAERVALAGGTLAHGPDDSGDFVLTAAFPWEG
jgi:signal transduction histidine kinase